MPKDRLKNDPRWVDQIPTEIEMEDLIEKMIKGYQ